VDNKNPSFPLHTISPYPVAPLWPQGTQQFYFANKSLFAIFEKNKE
jgi:hypothetical protein